MDAVKSSRSWDEMIACLHDALDGESADVEVIRGIMQSYKSSRGDWDRFAFVDPCKYTRNLVDEGNGKFNLMLLAWDAGQASSIHDHAGSHCFMKVLGGSVEQELYPCPDEVQEDEPMTPKSVSCHDKNDVLYISDKIGTHRVANADHAAPAFTLHLYSPPFQTCQSFDGRCGKARSAGKMTFYSKDGHILPPLER
eukprot:m.476852 g.476852  ORF g.476852 m.476852 type:complete len:196 (-) comp20675_c0_seq1:130-717(-)